MSRPATLATPVKVLCADLLCLVAMHVAAVRVRAALASWGSPGR